MTTRLRIWVLKFLASIEPNDTTLNANCIFINLKSNRRQKWRYKGPATSFKLLIATPSPKRFWIFSAAFQVCKLVVSLEELCTAKTGQAHQSKKLQEILSYVHHFLSWISWISTIGPDRQPLGRIKTPGWMWNCKEVWGFFPNDSRWDDIQSSSQKTFFDCLTCWKLWFCLLCQKPHLDHASQKCWSSLPSE